ncbi:MAG TPA: peptide deformylase [Candidatus Paceibacterota bacterium]
MSKQKPTLLRIAEIGNPVLRAIAAPVADPKAPEIQHLIDSMIATCAEQGGVGMAAPQVHESSRLMIIASTPTPAYPDAPKVKPFAVINPELIASSKETELGWEGCMSVPNIRGQVDRNVWVKVSYTDRAGKKTQKRFTGLIARIFQHELDHLNGLFFLDRANPKTLVSNAEFQKIMAKGKKPKNKK